MSLPPLRDRVAVVIPTRNRAASLLRTLTELGRLPDPPRVVVVDDASSDGTRELVAARFPSRVELIRRERRAGPVARNDGVARVRTPYVAFTDDDGWWAPGALERAAALLDRHPRLAVVTARILVGPRERQDPICDEMAHSPLRDEARVDGAPVVSFMAGASVVRRRAFEQVGGFEPRLMGGGEEETLACDLLAAGWDLRYVAEVVAHHHPPGGDKRFDRMLGIRNALWFAWRRRPLGPALRWTIHVVRAAGPSRLALRAYAEALRGLPWVVRTRRRVPEHVEAQLRALDGEKMRSRVRTYG